MDELDVDGWNAMIDVNLRGVLHGSRPRCRSSVVRSTGIW
jgi:NADP-dependent 3-hydroxy acid dehydrogenase YdfG